MPADPRTTALKLTARFRRQRPLRGGSLIVTILGDSIMPRGGAIALGSLIRLAAPFGLSERLVRTASARLAQDGWVQARRSGKLSEYRLTASGADRFAEATQRIYSGPSAPWTERWTLVVLPRMRAAERRAMRDDLTWLGFGELSPGVFAHPEIAPNSATAPDAKPRLPDGVLVFEASLAGSEAPHVLVRLGWDLAALASRYQRFVRRFEDVIASLRHASADPQTAFVLRTLLIHEYRKLHLRDPLLPQRLLPAHWPGTRAAQLCREIYMRVFEQSEAHLSAAAARLDGPLAPPDPSIMTRFGGLR
jgi:phenylacetic acid degradation operon negative regulatory protein